MQKQNQFQGATALKYPGKCRLIGPIFNPIKRFQSVSFSTIASISDFFRILPRAFYLYNFLYFFINSIMKNFRKSFENLDGKGFGFRKSDFQNLKSWKSIAFLIFRISYIFFQKVESVSFSTSLSNCNENSQLTKSIDFHYFRRE